MEIDFRPLGGLVISLLGMFLTKPNSWASFYGINWVLGLFVIILLVIMFRKYIFNSPTKL